MNTTAIQNTCKTFPPKINSQGVQVTGYREHGVLQYALPQMELQMVFTFAAAQACHFVLKRVSLPPFASQLLVRFHSSSRFFFPL